MGKERSDKWGWAAAARARARRFTLIEMLVVVAIISILAAMLSPSLMRALEAARAVACVNNMKQCGLALTTYANDWNGWMPGSQVYGWPWSGMLTTVTPRCDTPIAGDYIGDTKTFFCPGALYPDGGYRADRMWAAWAYTYGMNTISHENWDRPWQGGSTRPWTSFFSADNHWIRLFAAPSPGKKALLGDTLDNNDADARRTKRQMFEWHSWDLHKGHWVLHLRHQDRANMWFADGHVIPVSGPDLGEKYEIRYAATASGEDMLNWYPY